MDAVHTPRRPSADGRPRVAVLAGGPGPEPVAAARRALAAVAGIECEEVADGDLAALAGCDAVLADRPVPAAARQFGHCAGLLAVRPAPMLAGASPLGGERIANTDLLLVRGLPSATAAATERVARLAFDFAQRRSGRLAAVHPELDDDRARSWRGAVDRLAGEYADVDVEHLLDGEAASVLVAAPSRLDVLACDAALGGALAGLAAAITGLPRMLASASIGTVAPGCFTPAAAGAVGTTANPLPSVLAAALLLRDGLGMEVEAERLEVAVELALETGLRTPDLLLGRVGERRAGMETLADAVLSGLAGFAAAPLEPAQDRG